MPRYNEKIVELTKITTSHPIDTYWVYWETDMTYNIVGSSSQIIVRSHDQLLSGCSASLIRGTYSDPLPVGTYGIGTYSNPHPLQYDDFYIICATMGYVNYVLNNDEVVDREGEILIPNEGEESRELYATMSMLRPFYNPIRPGGYGVGASYSKLIIR